MVNVLSDNLRYEQKMVFDALRLDEVRSWVYTHPVVFRVAFPPRRVNNIYFDTLNRQLMVDHIQGVAARDKARFRWYGETWQAENGQIEVKKKIGRLGYKRIQPVPGQIDLDRFSWREIVGLLKRQSDKDFAALFDSFFPSLINHYQREYYVSMDGKIRVTLDYGMAAFEQSFGFAPNIRFPQPQRNDVVIEMKAAKEHHRQIADALAAFPLRCLQNSKYLNGMEYAV